MKYEIGKGLPTLVGGRNTLIVTELTEVNESGTYAKFRFKATDYSSKKKKSPISGKMEHRSIAGWIDVDGRWFS